MQIFLFTQILLLIFTFIGVLSCLYYDKEIQKIPEIQKIERLQKELDINAAELNGIEKINLVTEPNKHVVRVSATKKIKYFKSEVDKTFYAYKHSENDEEIIFGCRLLLKEGLIQCKNTLNEKDIYFKTCSNRREFHDPNSKKIVQMPQRDLNSNNKLEIIMYKNIHGYYLAKDLDFLKIFVQNDMPEIKSSYIVTLIYNYCKDITLIFEDSLINSELMLFFLINLKNVLEKDSFTKKTTIINFQNLYCMNKKIDKSTFIGLFIAITDDSMYKLKISLIKKQKNTFNYEEP